MGKKVEIVNYHVKVTPFLGRYCRYDAKQVCENIVSQIKRHIDEIDQVEIAFDKKVTCEWCGWVWTETTEHNGGCCTKDGDLMESIEKGVTSIDDLQ